MAVDFHFLFLLFRWDERPPEHPEKRLATAFLGNDHSEANFARNSAWETVNSFCSEISVTNEFHAWQWIFISPSFRPGGMSTHRDTLKADG